MTYEIRFDWQDHTVDKLASRHAAETWEVEECFFDTEQKKRRTREGKISCMGAVLPGDISSLFSSWSATSYV